MSELTDLEKQISIVINDVTQKQSQIRTSKEESESLLATSNEQISEAKEREFKLKRKITKIEDENRLLLSQESKLNSEISTADEQISKLEKELADLKTANVSLRKNTDEVEKESNRLLEIIEKIEEKINQNQINSKSIHSVNAGHYRSSINHYEIGNITSLISQAESSLVINEKDLKDSIRKFKRIDDPSELKKTENRKFCCVFK